MKIFSFLVFIICTILGCTHKTGKKAEADILISEFIYETAPFPECHASTIIETDNGLLTAWFGGTYERHEDVSIYISGYSNDRWSSPKKVADGIINDTLRYPCWNPVLFKKDNGELVLFYKVGPNPVEWWGKYKITDDNGDSWSEAISTPDSMLGPIKNKAQIMRDGKIIYPTSFETPEKWCIYVESSDQSLQNWKKTMIENNGFNAIQPTILFHKDGKIQMLCRSKEKKIVETWSSDEGVTWTPVEATSLPNNNSGIDAVTLDNGLFLLVCNPVENGRNKLSVLISDDGKAWDTLVVLEDQSEGEFSYPAIIQGKDGQIHITYTYNREKIKYIRLSIK
jgi:alpha-L-fucosidase